jgi:hypothetical protein
MSSSKRVVAGSSCPLDDAGIFLHMLNNLGPGHHLFISAVSKAWRESYKRVASVQMAGLVDAYHDEPVMHTIRPQTTLCSAVFTSAALVSLAHDCGAIFQKKEAQRVAGRTGDVSALQAAHALGLQLTQAVVIGAAEAASVPKLQWLHTEQGCALPGIVSNYAAASGSIDTLRWLKQHGCLFSSGTGEGAAAGAHLHVLQYLRAEGCEWGLSVCSAAAKMGHTATLQRRYTDGRSTERTAGCLPVPGGRAVPL